MHAKAPLHRKVNTAARGVTHLHGGDFRDERRTKRAVVRIGESSCWSGLRVDADGRLRRMDPSLGPHSLAPSCRCCAHTFDGVRSRRPCDPQASS